MGVGERGEAGKPSSLVFTLREAKDCADRAVWPGTMAPVVVLGLT